jgi:hypothetical protein
MALSPDVVMASSVEAQPGVFVPLLGSGVSRAAEIPTGWEIVTALVRRAAAAAESADEAAPERAAADPEAWWGAHGDGQPLGYSNLIASLGGTQASRRDLIARFFEPSDEDRRDGAKQPTAAHRAIAKLVRDGYVRVILTTNFDRLMERALEDESISPQVISRPSALAGSLPLAHARATIIKLHGDYADLDMRNTIDELKSYPAEWEGLLDRLTDEYGLIISGWSAEWDRALVAALERRTNRRYPLFWDDRSSRGETASRLVGTLPLTIVPAESADVMFGRLADNVAAIARLSEAPLSTAAAIARLKRYLPDPTRNIDLEELVLGAVDDLSERIRPIVGYDTSLPDAYQNHLSSLAEMSAHVVELLATGVYYDRGEEHMELWVTALQRLMDARESFQGIYVDLGERARHYPAMLALRAMGVAAVLRGHDQTLLALLRRVTWRSNAGEASADYWLHDYSPLSFDLVKSFSRWGGQAPRFPISLLLRRELQRTLEPLVGSSSRYELASSDYEYRLALIQQSTDFLMGTMGIASGLYYGYDQIVRNDDRSVCPTAESRFQRYVAALPDAAPLVAALGGREEIDSQIAALREHLANLPLY